MTIAATVADAVPTIALTGSSPQDGAGRHCQRRVNLHADLAHSTVTDSGQPSGLNPSGDDVVRYCNVTWGDGSPSVFVRRASLASGNGSGSDPGNLKAFGTGQFAHEYSRRRQPVYGADALRGIDDQRRLLRQSGTKSVRVLTFAPTASPSSA